MVSLFRIPLRAALGNVALVFPLELTDDLELGKSARTALSMMLKGKLWKHYCRPISRQSRCGVVGSQEPCADLAGQPSHFSLMKVPSGVGVFVVDVVSE